MGLAQGDGPCVLALAVNTRKSTFLRAAPDLFRVSRTSSDVATPTLSLASGHYAGSPQCRPGNDSGARRRPDAAAVVQEREHVPKSRNHLRFALDAPLPCQSEDLAAGPSAMSKLIVLGLEAKLNCKKCGHSWAAGDCVDLDPKAVVAEQQLSSIATGRLSRSAPSSCRRAKCDCSYGDAHLRKWGFVIPCQSTIIFPFADEWRR